ncbi:hypothetical protein KPH14_003880 [Odynerus spinipes]|uniref:Uncharacterized protein n=1 Tax=Odynerus spinipes TaxID=1348599 RepID=A0AAD9RXU1_9HYME|nr:hypothetical protein KPH14_003880 [Odynerus spinipes]
MDLNEARGSSTYLRNDLDTFVVGRRDDISWKDDRDTSQAAFRPTLPVNVVSMRRGKGQNVAISKDYA